MSKISQHALNELKRIAKECQSNKVHITQETIQDMPEVMQLVMMHMSKGYHMEELDVINRLMTGKRGSIAATVLSEESCAKDIRVDFS